MESQSAGHLAHRGIVREHNKIVLDLASRAILPDEMDEVVIALLELDEALALVGLDHLGRGLLEHLTCLKLDQDIFLQKLINKKLGELVELS